MTAKKMMLRRIEALFENKNNSVKDIRESLLKHSKEVGLDYHELNHIWDLAVANASEEIRKKVSVSVIPITKDKWLKNNLVRLLEIERDWLKDERFPKKDMEHLKWDIKMSEEILYLIKKNDDCQFTWLLALDGCQFTWLVEHLHFLKDIFENCTDTDHDHNHKKCKDDLKMVDQYLKIYMSKMLSLNYLIDFLEYTISFCNYCDNYSETLKDCDGDIELAKSEILEVKNTLRIAKQILKLCREVARGAKQLILTKEQRECLHQELKAYVNRRQVVYREVPTPDNKLSENELQTINGILTDIKP